MSKTSRVIKKIARLIWVIGSTSLILGIILSFVHVPASASPGVTGNNQPNACTLAFKCESPGCVPDPYSSWSAPTGYQICMIVIKAGTNYFNFASDGCVDNSPPPGGDGVPDYCVSGMGSGFGEAWRECVENGQTDCHAISHSEFYIDVLPPTPTPTETTVPSPTPTETSLPSPTPTETTVPSPTPTDTDIPPSPTPTGTGIPPSPTPTSTTFLPTETKTSTPTGTPIGDFVTPTATGTGTLMPPTATPTVLGTVVTPTSTQPTSQTQTPTPTVSGELATTVPTQATLPPPQVTGTQSPVLIPVTGVDLASPLAQLGQIQHTLINLGLALLGIGLIVHSIGKRIDII